MVARHYYRYVSGDPVEEVPNVLRWGYKGGQQAEEGQAPTYEIVVDDPDMEFDFVGHRRWIVYEDQSDDDNEVILDGLVQAVRVAHTGADITQPVGRVWTIEVADLNTLWTYRVMTGSDSQFPEQTDVERMQQLVDSEEMGYFDDLSLLSTGSPITLDKLNGRGQTTGQIADTCAQETGKNWYIYSTGSRASGADIGVWYGRDSLTAYASPLSLSNLPGDLDMPAVNAGTATTYEIGADTVLRRDYARQYSGAYGEFQGGAKYVVNPTTLAEITLGGRDMTHPAPEIKTRSRMTRRLTRILTDHADPDHVISMTIRLPANKVSQCRVGMRIFVTMTHEPGYESGKFLRIMTATLEPRGNVYYVALEMQGPGVASGSTCSVAISAAEADEATGLESGGTTAAVTSTPSEDGYLFGILHAVNQNSPGPSDMGSAAGYSTLDTYDGTFPMDATWVIGGKVAAAGTHTMTASFTPGFGSIGVWVAAQVWLPWSGFTVVQDKGEVNLASANFDAPVTLGNIILMVAMRQGQGTGPGNVPAISPGFVGPTTGWTELWRVNRSLGNSWALTACWARCADPADGDLYDWNNDSGGPQSSNIYIAEVEA